MEQNEKSVNVDICASVASTQSEKSYDEPEDLDKDSSSVRSQTYFIDLANLPDEGDQSILDISRKSMFSMFIGIDEKGKLNTPPRLSSMSLKKSKENHNGSLSTVYVRLSDLDSTTSRSDKGEATPETRISTTPDHNGYDSNTMSFHSENLDSLSRLFPDLSEEIKRRRCVHDCSLHNCCSVIYNSIISLSTEDEHSNNLLNSIREPDSNRSSANIDLYTKFLLGEDLLALFYRGISADIAINVDGRTILAHKCILISRCQYFAAALCNENTKEINLSGYPFKVVMFALTHIYGGVTSIPSTINIHELIRLTNILNLEGLKEVIAATLKQKYCHNFHDPCAKCLSGVLECLSIVHTFGFSMLLQKCLYWIMKHFQKVWLSSEFIQLAPELKQLTFKYHIGSINMDNIIEIFDGCNYVLYSISRHSFRYVEIRNGCNSVLEASKRYLAGNISEFLKSALLSKKTFKDNFIMFIVEAIALARPNQVRLTYELLHKPRYTTLTNKRLGCIENLRMACERNIARNVHNKKHLEEILLLSPHLKNKLTNMKILSKTRIESEKKPLNYNQTSAPKKDLAKKIEAIRTLERKSFKTANNPTWNSSNFITSPYKKGISNKNVNSNVCKENGSNKVKYVRSQTNSAHSSFSYRSAPLKNDILGSISSTDTQRSLTTESRKSKIPVRIKSKSENSSTVSISTLMKPTTSSYNKMIKKPKSKGVSGSSSVSDAPSLQRSATFTRKHPSRPDIPNIC